MLLRTLIFLTLYSLPSYVVRFTIFGLPTTLQEIILLAAVVVWAIEKIRTRTFPHLPRQWRAPIGLFLLASLLALFTAPQLFPALGHWRAYILEPIVFALVLLDAIKTERDRVSLIYALAASLIIPVALALYQQVTGNLIPNEFWADAATRRVTSIYGYPNALGLYAVPVLILILGRIFASTPIVIPEKSGIQKEKTNRNRFLSLFMSGSPIKSRMTVRRMFLTFLFLATTVAIVFTRSKGTLVALAVGVAVYCILTAKRKLLATSVLIVIAAIGIFVLKDSFNLRGISTVQGGDSVSVRLTQYRETWEILKDHPVFGAGLRGYQTAMIPYHQQNYIEIFMYPHNIFLAVWSELGLLGLIAFVWIIAIFFKTTLSPFCHSRENGNPDNKNKQKNPFWSLFSGSPIRSGMTIEHTNNLTIQQCNHVTMSAAALASMAALLVHGLVDVPYFKNDLAVLFWILISLSISTQLLSNSASGRTHASDKV
ncbi:hypothetical protein A3J43_03735 [Candidatus Uhrbacteria bacterium RIFCSPHIGHO2_12_FULL_54_23]|nr:MAG: hypothetical protein A3J43_03735 [Candidatus Uhrbacteria bacterium RIFCSPHIGHO2_12_FULL_54_23]OGL89723.1 MAG: hypothetical protein A3J36_02760 [Candidatus Uhrbacteria bacterium RIFCSPLOWO2_02_FULL_54_37]